MANRFSLGIEEEFQLVKRATGELCSCAQSVLAKGAPYFEEQIKPEMLQSTVELVSNVFPDMAAARTELHTLRILLNKLANEEGLALVSAGTHPSALWVDQERTDGERYIELEKEYQDVGRSILIFGLHVHVGIEKQGISRQGDESGTHMVASTYGYRLELPLLARTHDGHQVLPLRGLEALSTQWHAGSVCLLGTL